MLCEQECRGIVVVAQVGSSRFMNVGPGVGRRWDKPEVDDGEHNLVGGIYSLVVGNMRG